MKTYKKGQGLICINSHSTPLKEYATYRVEYTFGSGVYVKLEGIRGAFSPDRFIKLIPNSLYIGCTVVCIEPYFYYGDPIISVDDQLIIDSFTPDGKVKFKELPSYEFNQNHFVSLASQEKQKIDPIEDLVDEPKVKQDFFFSTPTGVLPVKELINALKYIDGDGSFVVGHDSDDETTFWVYKDKIEYVNSTLEIGDVVNHIESNRAGVVYLIGDGWVHVRFWDGGKHTFPVEGNDFKIMRKD